MVKEAAAVDGNDTLPHYLRPPLVETVFSLVFKPVEALTNAYLGAFWSSVRDEFPDVSDHATIPPPEDNFDEAGAGPPKALRLAIRHDSACRLQMKSRDGQRMIQVQNDRFIFNWIRQPEGDYPRYASLSEEYRSYLDRWVRFVDNNTELALEPVFWEVTYVNRIEPQDGLWRSVADWPGVLPGLIGSADSLGGRLEDVVSVHTYRRQDPDARLQVEVSRRVRTDDASREALRLALTARGPMSDKPLKPDDFWTFVAEKLNLGHQMIVMSFREFASDDANRIWGLQR